MTKLPQTIKVKVHTASGCLVNELPLDITEERCSGRTLAIILEGLGRAMANSSSNKTGSYVVYDHHSDDRESAIHLAELASNFIEISGLRGFSLELYQSNHLKHVGRSVWGCLIKYDQYMEVTYDLRK